MPHGGKHKRDPRKRYEFQGDINHTTKKCDHLKDEIESLAKGGHLGQLVRFPTIYLGEGVTHGITYVPG